jgi:virulence-associated protein VapD
MFAIAFDLVVADAAEHHTRGVTDAYTDIGVTLKRFGFERIQGSVTSAKTTTWQTSLPLFWL